MAGAERARRLLDLLRAERGLVCAVGAGGKKTTLQRLALAHRALGLGRVALTATVMGAPPDRELPLTSVIAEAADLPERLRAVPQSERLVYYALPSPKPGRQAGVPPELVARLHAQGGFLATLIKADGARMRLIKAPNPHEPLVPPETATVLALVSARAIGRPLEASFAHRLERLCAVIEAAPSDVVTPDHVARLLASPQGALHNVGAAAVIPVINMVDDAERRVLARAAARQALAMTGRFTRVILAAMRARDPVVEVVTR